MLKLRNTNYTTVSQIPEKVFEALCCAQQLYFERDFLRIFEEANPDITCDYVVLSSDDAAVALLIFQTVQLRLDTAVERVSFSARVARSLQCYVSNRTKGLLLLGNTFLSGPYGDCMAPNLDAAIIYAAIPEVAERLNKKRKASVLMIKDMYKLDALTLENDSYHHIDVAPNMVLQMNWADFETYKQSLKSKYRIKINKADQVSSSLELKSLSGDEVLEHATTLQELYQNVVDRASFNAGILDINTYGYLKRRFRESVYINTYTLDGRIVGFSTAFKVGNRLDAHFIGLDYSCSKDLALYPRMLNDYVRLGFELGVDVVNFGRTASEIKSTLGAVPEHLICYVKHRKTLANAFFKPILKQLQTPDFKQHIPFKRA